MFKKFRQQNKSTRDKARSKIENHEFKAAVINHQSSRPRLPDFSNNADITRYHQEMKEWKSNYPGHLSTKLDNIESHVINDYMESIGLDPGKGIL